MNDIRRTILWVIFGFSMVLLWDKWQVHNGNRGTFFPAPVQQAPAASAPNKPLPADLPAVAGTSPSVPTLAATSEQAAPSTRENRD